MPTAIFKKNVGNIDYTPGSAVSAGDVIVQATLVGIATRDIAASALGALAIGGQWLVPKYATAIPAGTKLYWDVVDGKLNVDDTNNEYAGIAATAALNTDANVLLILNA